VEEAVFKFVNDETTKENECIRLWVNSMGIDYVNRLVKDPTSLLKSVNQKINRNSVNLEEYIENPKNIYEENQNAV